MKLGKKGNPENITFQSIATNSLPLLCQDLCDLIEKVLYQKEGNFLNVARFVN